MASRPHPSSRRPVTSLAAAALLAGIVLPMGLIPVPARAGATDTPGGKGAQVYCFMRGAGNTHEVSWIAAYALIKRQSAGVFKTSPENAAVLITEAVVQNPGTFPDCGRFLGSLYEKAATPPTADAPATGTGSSSNPTGDPGAPRSNRYGY
jgi:hypothetical protein